MAKTATETTNAKRIPVSFTLAPEDHARLEEAKWALRKEIRKIAEDAVLDFLTTNGL